MRLGHHNRYIAALLASFLLCSSASGLERREAYGDGKGDQKGAAREAEDGNRQRLTPNMIQHFTKAQEHMRRASDARSRQDHQTADREEQMAQMEQMKGQQLKQQIDANKDSADKNRKSEQLVSKDDDKSNGKQLKVEDNQTVTVDKERLAKREATELETLAREVSEEKQKEDARNLEIARFDDFVAERKGRGENPAEPTKSEPVADVDKAPPPEEKKAWQAELEQLGKPNRLGIGYEDAAAPRSYTPGVTTVGADGASMAAAGPQQRLLGAATADEDTAGGPPAPGPLSAAAKAGADAPPKILAAKGRKKSKKDGEGDDFWKKIEGSSKGRKKDSKRSVRTARASKPSRSAKPAVSIVERKPSQSAD